MKKIILTMAIGLCAAGTFAQQTKHDKTKHLLEVSGSAQLGMQMVQQLMPIVKAAYPDVAEKVWDEFMKEINVNELIDKIVPVYEKYYTEQEIDQLIAFYDSPIGKKTRTIQGQILTECTEIGKQWGQSIGEKIVDKLEREHAKK